MKTLEQYLVTFQKEEFEIIVYVNKGWGGAGLLEGYHEITSYFPAMIDLRSGECIVEDGRIECLVRNENYEKDEYFKFTDNGIYRLLVTKCVQKELGPEMLASMNNRYLLKKVIEENPSCPELEAIREEYTKEIIIKVCETEFVLDRNLGWFEGEAEILGGPCSVYLYLDRNSKEKAKKASARFESLMLNIEGLDLIFKDYCALNMLDSANEWKENEDDSDITTDIFKEKMGMPNEMVVHSNGKVEILYSDGDMFGGHAIQISVNADNEIKDCEIVG